jgi:CzcA family heavy metal efflux pump
MIRSIVESSLRFRPLVVAIAALVMGIGVLRLRDMPVDVFPEVLPVTVSVQTEALGLSAVEVEQLITVPIEADLLTGTPWVETMRSESVPGLSSIELVFKPGTDPMDARQVVQERLTQAHALPNVSKPPQMLQPISSTNRIMLIGMSSEQQSLIEMSVLARWTIRPRLMGVPGVANVSIWGQRERQLQVLVDPDKLREEKISLLQIVKTAGNALWLSPLTFLESSIAGTGGFIETPNQRLGIRHVLPITSAAELAKVPVEETSLRLDQVATVVEDHQPLIGDAMNGHGPGLMLVVEKLPGVNTLAVTDEILAALDALKPGLGGVEFDPQVYQPATYIRDSISNVSKALLLALVLVALGFLALTYDWRAALIGLVAIPLSLMAALVVVWASGATINAMVLAGLVIALALVIDDSIIDADHFRRRLSRGGGKSTARALLEASIEIRSPLVFGTAIVLLAALPVVFMTGVPGAFVKPVVVAYALAVLASLVVATTVTPALGLMLMHRAHVGRRESPLASWARRRYENAPRSVAPRAAFALAVVALIVAAALLPRLQVSTAPTFKEPDLLVHWDAVPGTSRPEMNRIIDRVSTELRSVPGVRSVGSHVGRAIMSDQVVNVNSSELWVSLEPTADYDATTAAVSEVVAGYPGIDADVTTFLRSRFGEALAGVDEPIVVRLYGQELDVLRSEADKVRASLAGINGIIDAHVEQELEEPIVEIEVDLDAAKEYGVKPGDVRRAAATLLAGINVGNLFEEQKIFEVVVWGQPDIRRSVRDISNLLIDAPGGRHARLGDVARVQIVPAPDVVRRENVARRLDVVANVKGRDLDAVATDVRARIRESQFPIEYRAELLGDFAAQQASRQRVLSAAVAAVFGILLLFHAAVGSWSLATAVLLTLPIALAGGVIAAVATGTALSLGSLAGFFAVLGLAARHAVVSVSRYRDMRQHDGLAFGPDLVARGLGERVTPILTTTIVTALAVLPFILFRSRPGFEVLGGMAVVILGGLVTVTLYAWLVLPALYARFGAHAMPEAHDEDDAIDNQRMAV